MMLRRIKKQFAIIVVDPPWLYQDGFNGWGERKPLPYNALTVRKIKQILVGEYLQKEGHLILWTTNRYLGRSFGVAKAWGCVVKQIGVWKKPGCRRGLGGVLPSDLEFFLICQKIAPNTNSHSRRTRGREESAEFNWPHEGHSVKPDGFYEFVERRFIRESRLDVFARKKRKGWVSIGDAIDGKDILTAFSMMSAGSR